MRPWLLLGVLSLGLAACAVGVRALGPQADDALTDGAETPLDQARASFDRARALLESRRPDHARQALHELHQALRSFSALDEPWGMAETLYALAVASGFAGETQDALDFSGRAVAAFESIGDEQGLAAAHDHWGGLLAARGRLHEAEQHIRTALVHRRGFGDPGAIATSLHNLGSLKLEAGEPGDALALFEQAMAMQRVMDDPRSYAAGLNNVGLLKIFLGRTQAGRHSLEEALGIYRRLGDRRLMAGTLNNLGLVAWHQEDLSAARTYLDRALELYRDFRDDAGIADALGNLGLVDLEEGNIESARRRIEAAIHHAEQKSLRRIEASHLASRGRVRLAQDRLRAGLADLAEAADRQRALNDPEGLMSTLFALAQAHRRARDPVSAQVALDQAIATVDSMGSTLEPGDLRAYFLVPHRRLFDLQVEMQMDSGRPEQALLTSERARARGLLDLIRWADGVPKQALTEPPTVLAELQSLLDTQTRAVVYHLSEHRSWAWIMTHDSLRTVELGPAATLEALALKAQARLAQSRGPSRRGVALRAAERLAEAVLHPLRLGPAERLLVVPDGALYTVPFAALPTPDGSAMVERYELVQLPSLSVLAELRGRARKPTVRGELAVLADPVFNRRDPRSPVAFEPSTDRPDPGSTDPGLERLPYSLDEARGIARHFPPDRVRVLTGSDAHRGVLLNGELAGYRRLHLATHAMIDDRQPERSGLVLSTLDAQGYTQDGLLRLEDVFKLPLQAELVTLSACRSALGKPLRGEGLLGLTRGFFFAGARRVVASLWEVDDRATAVLMDKFYGALAERRDAADALATAQRALRRDPRWNAPFYWAGFVLMGDWQ